MVSEFGRLEFTGTDFLGLTILFSLDSFSDFPSHVLEEFEEIKELIEPFFSFPGELFGLELVENCKKYTFNIPIHILLY